MPGPPRHPDGHRKEVGHRVRAQTHIRVGSERRRQALQASPPWRKSECQGTFWGLRVRRLLSQLQRHRQTQRGPSKVGTQRRAPTTPVTAMQVQEAHPRLGPTQVMTITRTVRPEGPNWFRERFGVNRDAERAAMCPHACRRCSREQHPIRNTIIIARKGCNPWDGGGKANQVQPSIATD